MADVPRPADPHPPLTSAPERRDPRRDWLADLPAIADELEDEAVMPHRALVLA